MRKILIISIVIFFIASSCGKTKKKQTDPESISPNTTQIIKEDISDPTNTLSGKTETLQLKYIVWGCVCPNWIMLADYEKYQDEALGEHCIFIEPANENLELPADFDLFEHFIQVTGQFYVKPDYPKGTLSGEQQPLNKAKVFRYTEIKIFENQQKYGKSTEIEIDTTKLVKFKSKYNFKTFFTKIYGGDMADFDFTGNEFAEDKDYVDFIKKNAAGVNFGGHYTIIHKSCGAMCEHIFVVDRISGKVFNDINLTTTDNGNGKWGYLYRPDSKLLIANSNLFTTDSLNYYSSVWGIEPELYLWTGEQFKLLKDWHVVI